MTEAQPESDRLLDLLATYATQDLTSDERSELKRLLAEQDGVTEDEFETAAAAMHLAMGDVPDNSMPAELAEQIASEANVYFDQQQPIPTSAVTPDEPPSPPSGFRLREAVAWLAAAAALLFAFRPSLVVEPDPQPKPPTIQESYAALVDQNGTINLPWTALEDPTAKDASGNIVWNNDEQRGYMKMVNLGVNDPTEFQYQLWIFDKTQTDPIDGGVFDMTGNELIIPINAKLLVREPFQFAVTVERPGGVPKSAKERIPLLAKPQ